jgi:hypothetical protein
MSNKDEIFNDGHAYSKMIESPFFHAIVKFKWHAFARWYFLTIFFLIFTLFSLLIASTVVDLNNHMEIINSNKDYTNKINKAATKSYIAAVTMIDDLNNATNTLINNVTIAEAVKSNIEMITKVIRNVTDSKIFSVNIISEINKAAIEAVDNPAIYDTTFTAAIDNTTITTINNNYVTEITKAISEIDITTINSSTGSNQIMILFTILGAIVIFLLVRLFIILKINGVANRALRVPSTYGLIAGIILSFITMISKLFPETFKTLKYNYLLSGYDFVSAFQAPAIFFLGLWIVGLLCLFKNIGIFAYSKYRKLS